MSRSYKITGYDHSVDEIARRFHIGDPRILFEMNPDLFPTGSESMAIPDSMHGMTLLLPDDPDEALYDWEMYASTGGESLSAACAKKNKDRRIDPARKGGHIPTPPWLDPQYLLDAFRNAELRAGHGGDPNAFTLAKGEIVNIPFPRRRGGPGHIAAVPDATTTFRVRPDWVNELINAYESIRSRTRTFEKQLASMRELQRQALTEVTQLNALNHVLTLAIEHPAQAPALHPDEVASMRRLGRSLSDLHKSALDGMYTHLFKYVQPDHYDAMVALGAQILHDMRADRFVQLARDLKPLADRYPRVTSELCDVLGYAYLTLTDSPLIDDAMTDIHQSVAYVAALRPVNGSAFYATEPKLADAIGQLKPTPAPDSAIGLMLSVLGVATASVGNVAGPSSLAVAVLRARAVANARKQLDIVRQQYSADAANLSDMAETVGFSINAFTRSKAEEEELLLVDVQIRGGMVDLKATQFLDELSAKVGDSAMSSPRWVAGMGLLNVLALALASYDVEQNGWSFSRGLTLGAASAGALATGVTCLKLIPVLATRAGAWLRPVTAFAGELAAGVGVLVGLAQTGIALDEKDYTSAVLNGISTAGAALLLISLGTASPVLAIIGGALVVGAGIASVIIALKEGTLFQSAPERWWLVQQQGFAGGLMFQKVSTQDSDLSSKAAAFKQAIQNTDFLAIDVGQRDILRSLVADENGRRALLPDGATP